MDSVSPDAMCIAGKQTTTTGAFTTFIGKLAGNFLPWMLTARHLGYGLSHRADYHRRPSGHGQSP